MTLTFTQTLDCGSGNRPQCVHDPDGKLRVIYLGNDGLVYCREADPVLGLYDDLVYKEKGQISPDREVSLPSLKKVAHHGAFGFWSSSGDHKFVIYMMPTDISSALQDGSVSLSASGEVSSLNASFINIHGLLLNRYRALVTPGTKLELYFSIGGEETSLGVYYVDRANISYPEADISVTGRNTIGKLLKEQTFDENTLVNEGSIQRNIKSMLDYAGVEDYFVGDASGGGKLEFDPDTTILEGIKYAISLVTDWKVAETLDGRVGVARKDDVRFDQPSVYSFERDHNCWSYSIEFDDSDAAARVCVFSEGNNQDDPVNRAYADVTFNKWWAQPTHRTKHVKTVNGATQSQVQALANDLAAAMAISGRIETFAGLFTPQLTIGDEAHIIDENGRAETVGAVTDIKHNFGKGGFYTSFTVDSGGRKGRTTLKSLIDDVASSPVAYTGHRGEDEPTTKVSVKNTGSFEVTNSTEISCTLQMNEGTLAVAVVTHRSDLAGTPEGWTLIHTSTGIKESQYAYTQQVSIFYAFTTQESLSPTFSQITSDRMYVNFISLSDAGTPRTEEYENTYTDVTRTVSKSTSNTVLWIVHRVMWSSGKWTVTGVNDDHIVQLSTNGRLLCIVDDTDNAPIKISTQSGNSNLTEYLSIALPGES